MERKLLTNSIYRHFKGNLYCILGVVHSFKLKKDSLQSPYINTNIAKPILQAVDCMKDNSYVSVYSTPNGTYYQNEYEEDMVLYMNMYDSENYKLGTKFVRTISEFLSETDVEKYPELAAKQKYRFEEVFGESSDNHICKYCGSFLKENESNTYSYKRYTCSNCLSEKTITTTDLSQSISWRHGFSAKIICVFPRLGKTEYAETFKNTSEEIIPDDFKWDKTKTGSRISNPDYPYNMIDYIKSIANEKDIILLPTNEEVRNTLIEANFPYYLIYPDNTEESKNAAYNYFTYDFIYERLIDKEKYPTYESWRNEYIDNFDTFVSNIKTDKNGIHICFDARNAGGTLGDYSSLFNIIERKICHNSFSEK